MKRPNSQPVPFFRKRIVVIGAAFAAMLFALGVAWMGWYFMPDLPVRDVVFKGAISRVNPDELKRVAAAVGHARVSLLRTDLTEVKEAVKQVEWVRDVEVRRHLPGTLEVTLREQVAVARWLDAETEDMFLLNDAGEVFKAALTAEDEDRLPLLGGPVGAGRDVLAKFEEVRRIVLPLDRKLQGLVMNARGAWQATLDNGTVLALGRSDTGERLARFVSAYPQIPALQLADARVDLRYQAGLAVRGVMSVQPVNAVNATKAVKAAKLQSKKKRT